MDDNSIFLTTGVLKRHTGMNENSSFLTTDLQNESIRENTTYPFFSQDSEEIFHDIITQDVVSNLSYISNTILTPVICAAGIICNSFSIGVIWYDVKERKMSVYLYLLALTVLDISLLIAGLVEMMPWVIRSVDIDLSQYLKAHMRLGTNYAAMTFKYASRAIICVLSWDRIISLVRPLHVVKRMWFEKYPFRVILICFLLNAIFQLPVVIKAEVISVPETGNTSGYMFQYKNDDNFMKIFKIVQVVIYDIFLMLYLIILSIIIPGKFYFATKKRKTKFDLNSQAKDKKQEVVTLIVMVILTLYILLTTPSIVINILKLYNPSYNIHGKYRYIVFFLAEINDLLDYINAATDFLAYFLVSNRYRAVFKRKYCRCCFRGSTLSNDELNRLSQIKKPEAISVFINGCSFKLNYSCSFPDFSLSPPREEPVSDTLTGVGNFSKHYLSI